ncbi:MAG: HNH endonuclease [Rhodospirillales bacterium CG15_BIG_FIL_POST_REV_8_21_14_020_66_15]|nr:MAG: HNH endonuclease [Rhodospirillales bacterium CG15_BIG_FIL_POST_REV_8_21_14_020_66_15]
MSKYFVTASAVRSAISEFDKKGRERFLSDYGFGKARSYFLIYRRKKYDSKAILGVAIKYSSPNSRALGPYELSGGDAKAATTLRNLGFTVNKLSGGNEGGSKARNPAWSRDELILALDFYLKHRERTPDKRSKAIAELSREVNAVARLLGHAPSATLRNVNGVYMKLMNFRRLDPDVAERGRKGLTRGNKDEAVVWNKFAGDQQHLRQSADAIRARLAEGASDEAGGDEFDEPEVAEAEEGRLVTRLHRWRERSRKLVASKKAAFLKAHGRLYCEACGFDFEQRYGERGAGYIECHHTRPVHTLRAGEKTKLADLAMLCANCHRMVHARAPWLKVMELREILYTRHGR